ncbi:MAG: carboxypeptidase-like regulatory domain-containing protein, partial [Bryobacteraceae bacterium]
MAVLLLAVLPLGAQEFRGTIMGTVTDPQGGVVPNATVEIRNLDTNVVSTLRTNESGVYVAPLLIPGRYSVTANAPGFKKAVREPVQLYVGARVQVDLTLEVGATTETVTVTAEADLLETATASRGQLVDSAKVRDLPLLGRNPFLLAATTPGVYSGLYTGKVASYGRPFDGAAAQMSMQGIGGRYEVLL